MSASSALAAPPGAPACACAAKPPRMRRRLFETRGASLACDGARSPRGMCFGLCEALTTWRLSAEAEADQRRQHSVEHSARPLRRRHAAPRFRPAWPRRAGVCFALVRHHASVVASSVLHHPSPLLPPPPPAVSARARDEPLAAQARRARTAARAGYLVLKGRHEGRRDDLQGRRDEIPATFMEGRHQGDWGLARTYSVAPSSSGSPFVW